MKTDVTQVGIRLTLAVRIAWAVGALLISGAVWVGSIQAKVENITSDSKTMSDKIDMIQKDTSYIKGAIDEMRN